MTTFRPASLALLALAVLAQACAKDDSPKKKPPYLGSPLCSELVVPAAPNELFTSQLVLSSAISHAYPFGGTEPSNVQEVINFELGFYIVNDPLYANTPLTAPADLYVNAFSVSRYDDDQNQTVDREDFGVSYEVCSMISGDEQVGAVLGNFAHLASLSVELTTLLEAEQQKLLDGVVTPEESPLKCANGVEGPGTCTLFTSLMRETDPDFQLLLTEGALFATAAFPGFDANLQDRRRNDGAGNYFINPARWTAESGHAQGYKWGACTYEYFSEPYKTQYLRKIGSNGVYRNLDGNSDPIVVDHPCGLLEADLYGDGTAAGYWMLLSASNLYMSEDMSAQETEAVLSGLVVLSEDFLTPNTHIAMSTSLLALSGGGLTPSPMLVEFPIDTPPATFTNVPFADVVPGTVYCYEGTGYLNLAAEFNFLLELTNTPEPKVTIERLADNAPCNALAQVDRVFTSAKVELVR